MIVYDAQQWHIERDKKRKKTSSVLQGRKKNMGGRRLVSTPFLWLLVFLKNRHEAQTHTRSSHVAELRCAHTQTQRKETEKLIKRSSQ